MAAKKTQTPISETLFHETDSFLAIIVDLWLSVAGKVRGRLEKRDRPLQIDDEEVQGRPSRLLRIEGGGAAYPPRYFAKRHPRVWVNVVTKWFLNFFSRDPFGVCHQYSRFTNFTFKHKKQSHNYLPLSCFYVKMVC